MLKARLDEVRQGSLHRRSGGGVRHEGWEAGLWGRRRVGDGVEEEVG